ncbi:MAG: hypothetical protein HIU84_06345 [Acidobacteria bacterium]|nr:hypothetical protein [Acidobacteriota bacterium]
MPTRSHMTLDVSRVTLRGVDQVVVVNLAPGVNPSTVSFAKSPLKTIADQEKSGPIHRRAFGVGPTGVEAPLVAARDATNGLRREKVVRRSLRALSVAVEALVPFVVVTPQAISNVYNAWLETSVTVTRQHMRAREDVMGVSAVMT